MTLPKDRLHPRLLYYGRQDPPWPRILVIGQEANSPKPVGDHVGTYDLPNAAKRRVHFWTGSHKAIQRAAGFPGLHLRKQAIQVGSSPIVYADASPRSVAVSNRVPRPKISDDELAQHGARLFALPQAMACPLIVVSGHKSRWQAFYDVVEAAAEYNGAKLAYVPFYGQGPATTEERYLPLCEPEVRLLLRKIVYFWAEANDIELGAPEE